jgi:hypothetical protein
LYENLCVLCKHHHGIWCEAFPDRIPLEIRKMYADHRLPYAGDHGILFEPKDHSEKTLARLAKVRVHKKPDMEKVRAVAQRVFAVRSQLASMISERGKVGDDMWSKLWREMRHAESFDELAPECRDLILEAERRQAHEVTP